MKMVLYRPAEKGVKQLDIDLVANLPCHYN